MMARKKTIDNFRVVKPIKPKRVRNTKVLVNTFEHDIPGFFKRFGIEMDQSQHVMINRVGIFILDGTNPTSMANSIITMLGGTPIPSNNFSEVDMSAKHMALTAFTNPLGFNAAHAQLLAKEYVTQKKKTSPWFFVSGESKMSDTTTAPKSNDKKAIALEIYGQCKDMPIKHVVERIMTELDITYANAYYYVRAFNKQFA